MLAKNNTYIQEASETIYQLTAEAAIREQCEARNAYYAWERHYAKIQKAYDEATLQLETFASENNVLASENEALKKEIEALKAQLAEK